MAVLRADVVPSARRSLVVAVLSSLSSVVVDKSTNAHCICRILAVPAPGQVDCTRQLAGRPMYDERMNPSP